MEIEFKNDYHTFKAILEEDVTATEVFEAVYALMIGMGYVETSVRDAMKDFVESHEYLKSVFDEDSSDE